MVDQSLLELFRLSCGARGIVPWSYEPGSHIVFRVGNSPAGRVWFFRGAIHDGCFHFERWLDGERDYREHVYPVCGTASIERGVSMVEEFIAVRTGA